MTWIVPEAVLLQGAARATKNNTGGSYADTPRPNSSRSGLGGGRENSLRSSPCGQASSLVTAAGTASPVCSQVAIVQLQDRGARGESAETSIRALLHRGHRTHRESRRLDRGRAADLGRPQGEEPAPTIE